jgi:hypothetical protein
VNEFDAFAHSRSGWHYPAYLRISPAFTLRAANCALGKVISGKMARNVLEVII